MTNFRYAGYLLIALGLINLRYQTGTADIVMHSLLIVLPGALLLGATFLKKTQELLLKANVKYAVGILVAGLVIYAFINN